jgi:hypothetical protein
MVNNSTKNKSLGGHTIPKTILSSRLIWDFLTNPIYWCQISNNIQKRLNKIYNLPQKTQLEIKAAQITECHQIRLMKEANPLTTHQPAFSLDLVLEFLSDKIKTAETQIRETQQGLDY